MKYSPLRILIIEDEPSERSVIKHVLQDEGCEAFEAGSGEEGLRIANTVKPDMILCDIRMPGMDGFETLKAFQRTPELASIPFIFITAATDKSFQRKAMDLGGDDFLPKPYTREELLQAIEGRIARVKTLAEPARKQISQMQGHLEETKTLSAITQTINTGYLLEDILDRIFKTFRNIIPYERIDFALIEQSGNALKPRWRKSDTEILPAPAEETVPIGLGDLREILSSNKPRIMSDGEHSLSVRPSSELKNLLQQTTAGSILACRISANEKIIGILFFSHSEQNKYKILHSEILMQVAEQLAVTIEKARLYQELIELNTLKNRFLGMAVHDLRNPLSAIKGFSEILLTDKTILADIELKEMVTLILLSSTTSISLINDLLDINAIESGKLILKQRHIPVNELITPLERTERMMANRKGIILNFEIEAKAAEKTIYCDPVRLKQILENLISNAVKFSYAGSEIRVSLSKQGDHFLFTVRDQGQGIPAEDLPKLFSEFSRASVRPTQGEISTGLGLAIVKKLVLAHNGKVWAESSVGQGSSFHFTIPA